MTVTRYNVSGEPGGYGKAKMEISRGTGTQEGKETRVDLGVLV